MVERFLNIPQFHAVGVETAGQSGHPGEKAPRDSRKPLRLQNRTSPANKRYIHRYISVAVGVLVQILA